MRTEDVLDQIDQALDDWEVGPDAMRCAPERSGPPTTPRRPPDRFSFIPTVADPAAPTLAELSSGQDLSPYIASADTWASDFADRLGVDLLPFQRHFLDSWVPGPGDRVLIGFDGSRRSDTTTVVVARAARNGCAVTLHLIDEARWAAAVEGNQPLPLPIDGHEYARRRRNRRRS